MHTVKKHHISDSLLGVGVRNPKHYSPAPAPIRPSDGLHPRYLKLQNANTASALPVIT